MLTLLAFVLALGLLITVHEYGHYRVARACGVKVLKFSIGFGKPIFSWRWAGLPTEFSIGILPLGGYVAMLDEREGPVDPEDRLDLGEALPKPAPEAGQEVRSLSGGLVRGRAIEGAMRLAPISSNLAMLQPLWSDVRWSKVALSVAAVKSQLSPS